MATVVGIDDDGNILFNDNSGRIKKEQTHSTVAVTPGPQGPAGGGPPSNVASFQHVAPWGNDSNDGLTWQNAKLTVIAAYDALPNSPGNGGGTIYINDGGGAGVSMQADGKSGIWIIGPNDPGWPTIPPNWRAQKTVTFIGIPSQQASQNDHWSGRCLLKSTAESSQASNTIPGIWLSGTNTTTHFENLDILSMGRCVVLGETSAGNRTLDTTATVSFKNCGFLASNTNSVFGPTVDITSESFWIFFEDCDFTANNAATPIAATNGAAVLISGNSGLIFVTNCNIQSGGAANGSILFNPTNSGTGTLYVTGLTTEAQPGPNNGAVYFSKPPNTALIQFVTVSDSFGGPVYAVYNPNGFSPDAISCIGCAGGSAVPAFGPATVLGANAQNQGTQVESYLRMGQQGIVKGRLIAQSDSHRRSFSPSICRFANIAPQVAASWSVTQSAGVSTLVTGISALDGTLNAGQASSTAASPENLRFYNQSHVVAVGDYWVFGAWVRSQTANGYATANNNVLNFQVAGAGNAASVSTLGVNILGDGEWEWVWGVAKITAANISPATITFYTQFNSTFTIEAYAPVLIYIPSGTVPDNEVYELALHLASFPDTAIGGDVMMLRGQRLGIGGSTNFFGKLTHANTADHVYTFPDQDGTVLVGGTEGFGNGAAAQAVTTTLKGTGSGPATPQIVVGYAPITYNGQTYWVPLMQ